jgi:hypothetical protein
VRFHADLFNANPKFRTTEVPEGTKVELPQTAISDFLDRTRDALRDAGNEVERAARRAGKSVSDYLADNPDLNRDILHFGERLGLPGFNAPVPVRGADVAVIPLAGRPGDKVTLRATGLRGNVEVTIGAGRPGGGYTDLKRARTDASGELSETVIVPEWAANHSSLVFVVETDRVRVSSEIFQIAGR